MSDGFENVTRKQKTEPAKLRRMEPFTRDDLQLIRAFMRATSASTRDRTLLEVGIDSMLRCGDLLRLRVSDVRDINGRIMADLPFATKKTGVTVDIGLTDKTRALVASLIEEEGKWDDDYLFTQSGQPHGKPLSEVMLRRIIKRWAAAAHLNADNYSGHSLRRTKAVFVYRQTKDYETVRVMLGHESLAHTIKYLGIKGKDAAATARSFDL
jgi:integrase